MTRSESDNAFQILGITAEFEIDEAKLERAYLKAQAKWHPDRFSDPDQRAEAERRAAEINDAHRVLADPERRADHLLASLGGPAKEDDKSLPDGFLMEMLEVREQMASDLASDDDDDGARDRWQAWASSRRDGFMERVAAGFQAVADGDDKALQRLRVELNAWRYIERMIEQLDPDYDHQRELRDAGG